MTITQNTSSESSKRTVNRRVLSYLFPYRKEFFLALFCMILFGASDGIIPFLIKQVLDGVFAEQNRTLLTLLPIALVLFAVLRATADFGQQYIMSKIGHNIVRDIRNQFHQHILKLSNDFFLSNAAAQLISKVTSDVVLVRTLLTDAIAAVLRDSIRVIALLGAALYLDSTLALIAAIVFPIGIWPVYKFGRRLRKLSRQGQDAIGAIAARMSEVILGNKIVKIFGRQAYEAARFENENQALTKTFIKSEKFRALGGPVNEVLASVGVAAVMLYGGLSVMNGFRSQGEFLAFLVAVFLMYDPFKKLTRVNSTIQQGLAGAQAIFDVLDTAPTVIEASQPNKLGNSNDILFESVSYTYPNLSADTAMNSSKQAAIKEVNLAIRQGQKIAIVGFSGAGKSTLVDLIPRFMDPQVGRILIGGQDIATVSLSELRSRIAMVGQHTILFNDTVFNNIAYGNSNSSKEQVEQAAKAAFAHDFIMQLPSGYDTIVGEGGFSLSGGERQRLAIARAILKNAPILVLDEATASLDNRSEREVQLALDSLIENRTCIIIAHRLSTVRNADLVVVMSEGRIVELGTHDALLQMNGEFSRLHALQFVEKETTKDLSNCNI